MSRFATKAEWADAKAREMEQLAGKLQGEYCHYTKLRKKLSTITFYHSEAARFRSLAEYFRRKDV